MMRWTSIGLLAAAACVGNDPLENGPGDGDLGAEAGTDGGASGGPSEAGSGDAACSRPSACTTDLRALDTCKGVIPCALGCNPVGRCQEIAPSGAAGQTETASASLQLAFAASADAYVVDTATGSIGQRGEDGSPIGVPVRSPGVGVNQGIGYAVVAQPDGAPQVAVFSFASLSIPAGASLRVVGPHAVAFVSRGDVAVDGLISVRADCANQQPGPGGFAHDLPATAGGGLPGGGGAFGRTVINGNTVICGGGGGGGNGTTGGAGGNAHYVDPATYVTGAGGGAARTSLLEAPVLAGGGGGSPDSYGGAGGGAIHLVSSGTIVVGGTIDGGGCGGRYSAVGPHDARSCSSSGGGGAGGTVFLEAGIVRIGPTGRVLVNGGGGGGGKNQDVYPATGVSGAEGSATDITPAAGGASTTADPATCPGGQNGNPIDPPTAESQVGECVAPDKGISGSGGGGAVGHIAARTYTGAVEVEAGALLSVEPVHDLASAR